MPKFVVAIASVATALATPVCGTGVYKQPKLSSFAVVSANLGLPVNTTTFDGITALFPLYKGSIAGKFKGHLVNSTSVVRERVLPGSDGAHSVSRRNVLYGNCFCGLTKLQVVSTDLIFENEKEEHILVHMDGQTTYANKALHGFGRG